MEKKILFFASSWVHEGFSFEYSFVCVSERERVWCVCVCVCVCLCFKEPRANNLIGMCKLCLSLRRLLGLLPLKQVVKKTWILFSFSQRGTWIIMAIVSGSVIRWRATVNSPECNPHLPKSPALSNSWHRVNWGLGAPFPGPSRSQTGEVLRCSGLGGTVTATV